ncbi:hypothetical protein P7H19_13215 [Paenibacillus larvae]|nr:hypothetical protein [Paenibacillus larvae]MDT2237065.1 hypothetical protein [Paenibacillus larvae]
MGRVAACGVVDPESKSSEIVLFVVFKKSAEHFAPLVNDIKKHLYKRGGWSIKDVLPVRKLPKTTSGKVQRYELARQYESGKFLSESAKINEYLMNDSEEKAHIPVHVIETELLSLFSEVLGGRKFVPVTVILIWVQLQYNYPKLLSASNKSTAVSLLLPISLRIPQ